MATVTVDDQGRCVAAFRLPDPNGASRAWVAGDFNDWSLEATPMTRAADGSLSATVVLQPGRRYRFRYYLGDGAWENDWDADEYVPNEFGGADSVITTPGKPAPKQR